MEVPAGGPDPRPRETVSRQSILSRGPPLHTARGTCGRRDNYMPVLSTRRRHAPKHRVSIEPSTVARRISVHLQSKDRCEERQKDQFWCLQGAPRLTRPTTPKCPRLVP